MFGLLSPRQVEQAVAMQTSESNILRGQQRNMLSSNGVVRGVFGIRVKKTAMKIDDGL